jgi:hypothetical protein
MLRVEGTVYEDPSWLLRLTLRVGRIIHFYTVFKAIATTLSYIKFIIHLLALRLRHTAVADSLRVLVRSVDVRRALVVGVEATLRRISDATARRYAGVKVAVLLCVGDVVKADPTDRALS